jgi:hypothetical protein
VLHGLARRQDEWMLIFDYESKLTVGHDETSYIHGKSLFLKEYIYLYCNGTVQPKTASKGLMWINPAHCLATDPYQGLTRPRR